MAGFDHEYVYFGTPTNSQLQNVQLQNVQLQEAQLLKVQIIRSIDYQMSRLLQLTLIFSCTDQVNERWNWKIFATTLLFRTKESELHFFVNKNFGGKKLASITFTHKKQRE